MRKLFQTYDKSPDRGRLPFRDDNRYVPRRSTDTGNA
jgi:hypothetical protein